VRKKNRASILKKTTINLTKRREDGSRGERGEKKHVILQLKSPPSSFTGRKRTGNNRQLE